MPRSDDEELQSLLVDLAELSEWIAQFVQQVGTRDAYLGDPFHPFTAEGFLVRLWEIINRLPDRFTAMYPDVPWHEIRGMGNYIAHRYDNVNHGVVWRTLTDDVPRLRTRLADVLPEPPPPGAPVVILSPPAEDPDDPGPDVAADR